MRRTALIRHRAIVGMGSLFAEGMVLASGNFAQKTEAYGKQLEAEGRRKG